MLIKLLEKAVRSLRFRATRITHRALVETIIKDSGMDPKVMRQCIETLMNKTAYLRESDKRLCSQFADDLSLIPDECKGSLAFVCDELYAHIYRYREYTPAFNVYCLIGKVLDAK